jgi:hypothetical protein
MLGALATLLSAVAATVLPTSAACPSADSVAAELDRLGAFAALAALGTPEVTIEGAKMHVVLRGHDGSILGSREVAAPEACHERAAVAAVFVAAWVGAWSTQPMSNFPSPNSTTAAPATGVSKPRETAVQAAGKLATPTLPTPSTAPSTTPPTTPPRPPARVSSRSTEATIRTSHAPMVEVAGLAFGTHNGDAGTFGAGVFASYAIGDAMAVAMLLETTGERQTAVGPVIATYRTSRLGVGVSVRRRWGRWFGDAGLFPELTVLTANGQPLVIARSVTTWGAALDVRGRLGLVFGRFVPFLLAGGSGALRAESLTLDDYPQASTTLSRWNLSVGAGLAVFFGAKE